MTIRFAMWTLDVRDVELMIDFWSRALDYSADRDADGSAMLYPARGASRGLPNLWLQNTGEPKNGKLRCHPDVRPTDGDVTAEVERLVALGARRAEVGQTGEEPFTVMADPEGNEFCVLHAEPRHR